MTLNAIGDDTSRLEASKSDVTRRAVLIGGAAALLAGAIPMTAMGASRQ